MSARFRTRSQRIWEGVYRKKGLLGKKSAFCNATGQGGDEGKEGGNQGRDAVQILLTIFREATTMYS